MHIEVRSRFFLLAVLILVVGACDASPPGNEIRVAITDDIRSTYPGVNRVSFSDDVLIHVVEPMVVHRGDLSIAPMAAESYQVSDDLTTYRFHLRDGLRYHNDEPVLAQHYVDVWTRYLDPKTGFQCLPFYDGTMGERVVSVDAPDAATVVITLDRPSAVFLEKLAYLQCPVPLLHPDSWDEHGNWLAPIGTGPFRLREWRKGRYVLLEKYPGYVPRSDAASGLAGRKVAYADYLRFVIIKDLMATKAALVSGQVDVAGSLAPVTALEIRHNKRVVAMDHPGLGRRTLLIQTADPLLSDVRIRRAMAHALDLQTFAEVASLGTAPHNPSTLPLGVLEGDSSGIPAYEYDVSKAKALLSEAGYAGQEIVLKTTRSEQAFFDIAMIAEAMWKKAGLSVRVEVMELGSLLSDYLDGNYQVMAFEYTARFTPIMNFQTLLGNTTLSPSRWGDKKANDLLAAATKTADPGARQAIYEQIHRRMMAEVPVINIYNAPIVDVVATRLDGYAPWIGAKPRLWNVRIIQ